VERQVGLRDLLARYGRLFRVSGIEQVDGCREYGNGCFVSLVTEMTVGDLLLYIKHESQGLKRLVLATSGDLGGARTKLT
jgi:hypothetical protein